MRVACDGSILVHCRCREPLLSGGQSRVNGILKTVFSVQRLSLSVFFDTNGHVSCDVLFKGTLDDSM